MPADVSADMKPELFLNKLHACRHIYIWQDGVEPEQDPEWGQKELKRKQLIELVDYINQNHEGNLKDVMEFVTLHRWPRRCFEASWQTPRPHSLCTTLAHLQVHIRL